MSAINRQKFDAIWGSLPETCRKVYGAVPIQQVASLHDVCKEIGRQGKTAMGYRDATHCIGLLADRGLIKRAKDGFIRVPIKDRPVITVRTAEQNEPKPQAEKPMPQPQPKESPMDALLRVVVMAKEIQAASSALIAMAESTALEIEAQFSESEKKSERLRQLQALLKDIGTGG